MFVNGITQTPLKSLQKFWMASVTAEYNKEPANSSEFFWGLGNKMHKASSYLKKPLTTEQDMSWAV